MSNETQLLKQQYQTHQRGQKRAYYILLLLIPFLVAGGVASGSAEISWYDVLRTLYNKLFALADQGELSSSDIIIWELRLPRVVMGVLCGIALGISGAVMQNILKNPMADPYMLGIASAAGFGASLAIITGIGVLGGTYLIIGNAFFFSALASLLILVFAGGRSSSPEKMVLVGLALLFFFQAMITLLQYFGDAEAVKAAVFWTVGDLGKTDWSEIQILLPILIFGFIALRWKAADLNIMNSGDTTAKSLGVKVEQTRIFVMLVCTLIVASAVSFTGTIGFIGLVAPHLVRMAISTDNKILIPASGLVGAILLVLSDTLARTMISPVVLPVGAVTAFLGVPLFLYLIVRKKGSLW